MAIRLGYQLGDKVTWSDIYDIQLKHFVFWSNNKVIELETFGFLSNTVGIGIQILCIWLVVHRCTVWGLS